MNLFGNSPGKLRKLMPILRFTDGIERLKTVKVVVCITKFFKFRKVEGNREKNQ